MQGDAGGGGPAAAGGGEAKGGEGKDEGKEGADDDGGGEDEDAFSEGGGTGGLEGQDGLEVERFKDAIMKQLEDSAFSIEEAHKILVQHFGTQEGDGVKDAVLAEWSGEVGITTPVATMSQPERLDALDRVAKWLFQ